MEKQVESLRMTKSTILKNSLYVIEIDNEIV